MIVFRSASVYDPKMASIWSQAASDCSEFH